MTSNYEDPRFYGFSRYHTQIVVFFNMFQLVLALLPSLTAGWLRRCARTISQSHRLTDFKEQSFNIPRIVYLIAAIADG